VEWKIIRKRQHRLILWGNKVKEGQCKNLALIAASWAETREEKKLYIKYVGKNVKLIKMAHDRIKWLVPISVVVNSQGLLACRSRTRCELQWLGGAVEDLRKVGSVIREADSNCGLQTCWR
jgi:hypothetical protein